MRASIFTVAIISGLIVGCSRNPDAKVLAERTGVNETAAASQTRQAAARLVSGNPRSLLRYDRDAKPVRRGASIWYPVQLSEQSALRAITQGTLTIDAPDGGTIALEYDRYVEHPSGNWTWVGRTEGPRGGTAVMTFGEKAIFASIPNGDGEPLQITTALGRTWLVKTDKRLLRAAPGEERLAADYVAAPRVGRPNMERDTDPIQAIAAKKATMAAESSSTTSAAATASSTVDIVIGYTAGFATRLGGTSQARTRLDFLVSLTNQAYVDSQVDAQVRLVQSVQVAYPDNTANTQALFGLTGVSCTSSNSGSHRLPDVGQNCTSAARPAALQPLIAAREQYGADLVSLVRVFNSPENGSCGVGWLLGAGQVPIVPADADFGFSVVSDTNGNQFPDDNTTCREEYLAHELGHNMGLQHDRGTAQGSDDTDGNGNLLDPEEFGRYPYTFGHSTGEGAGNFYTIMALRRTGQTGYRVFSNPRITFCGGLACGVTDQADNARGLPLTIPVIAAFRSPRMADGDFDGDIRSDILWRNNSDGRNGIWRSANSATSQSVATVAISWKVVGVGDFNADGKSDVLWRNSSDGRNVIWRSASSATPQAVTTVNIQAWKVVGVGDFDGNGVSDILWRNSSDGRNAIWRSGNSATPQAVTTVMLAWQVAGVGDFNNDGRSDILWRNASDGRNVIWRSGTSATPQAVSTVAQQAWKVVGVGDFDVDGSSDILWRNTSDGRNVIWRSGNSATAQAVATLASQAWKVAKVGDFDGDGRSDILWRNSSTGENLIWKAANSTTTQTVTTVASQAWIVAG